MRTHKKTYVLLFLCLHFKRQKNTRTKEESITTGDAHAQKKLMSFCSYVYTLKDRRTQEQKKNQ